MKRTSDVKEKWQLSLRLLYCDQIMVVPQASSAFHRTWYFIQALSTQFDQCLQRRRGGKRMINLKHLSPRPSLERSVALWWMSQGSLFVFASQTEPLWKYLMVQENPHCSLSASVLSLGSVNILQCQKIQPAKGS